MFFKKTVPFILTLSTGIFSFCYYFIPHKQMQDLWFIATSWLMIIGGGAMAVGVISMIRTYWKKARNKQDPNRYYCYITLVCMAAMSIVGFAGGIKSGTLFNTLFKFVMAPLESTMFSLLAFYIASAAFRSFRLKSFSAGLLLVSAMLVMLSQIPTGEVISPYIPKISAWILDHPNVAAQRAIQIGISIGVVSTALKIILGIDKSVFSGVGK